MTRIRVADKVETCSNGTLKLSRGSLSMMLEVRVEFRWMETTVRSSGEHLCSFPPYSLGTAGLNTYGTHYKSLASTSRLL